MPSPTLMTVPTSATVTPASKFSICWRMISLISFALIGSISGYLNFATEARRHRDRTKNLRATICSLIILRVSVPLWLALGSSHLFLNLLQLAAHRAVVNSRADSRHQSADDVRISSEVDTDFLPSHR